jgi:hypothetical protein
MVLGTEVALEELLIGAAGTTVVFGVLIVVAVSGVKDVVEAIDDWKEIEKECDRQRTECLMSHVADEDGGLHKHSRCHLCREACMKNGGVWPSRVRGFRGGLLSCQYWLDGKKR